MVVADQDPRETLRVALREFDTPHLQRLRTAAYDRWTWDSGSQIDRDWFEVADEILREERGVVFDMSGSNPFGSGIVIGAGNMPTHLKIAAEKVVMENPNSMGMDHEIFEFSGGQLDMGFALKALLVKVLGDELAFGSLTTSQGVNLRSAIEMIAAGSVSNAEWAIRPMFEQFMEEYEEAKRKKESEG